MEQNRMHKSALILALCLACALPGGNGNARRNEKPRLLWQGKSGSFDWRWTTEDISAHATVGRTAYSFRKQLLIEKKQRAADFGDTLTAYEVSCKVLSVVGSLLSVERHDYWDGGAHPSGWERFVVVDAAHPKREVKLTDLFPDATIRDALLADPIVRQVRNQENLTTLPRTTAELIAQLKDKMFDAADGKNYMVPDYLLEDFAFHHIKNGKVAIRFCLPHGAEIFRFNQTQIGILLPVSERLRRLLSAAQQQTAGILMQDARKLAGNAETKIVLYSQERRH